MTNDLWIPIAYGDFYDVPRAFVVELDGEMLFFDCLFEDEIDDYPEEYRVYRLVQGILRGTQPIPWINLKCQGVEIGRVSTAAVPFDETRRKKVNASVMRQLLSNLRD